MLSEQEIWQVVDNVRVTRGFVVDVARAIERAVLEKQQPELLRDAARYRWLRQQHWNEAPLCVVVQPRQAVKLGHDCPALDRLDAVVDQAMTTHGVEGLDRG